MAKRKGRGPSKVIADRLKTCRRKLRPAKAGGFLVSNTVDYFYLTGFTGEESAVMVTPRDVHIISDSRFESEIKRQVPWATHWMRRGMLNDEIVKACKELKIKKLAVQGAYFPVGDQAELQKRVRGMRCVIAPPTTEPMRCIKSAPELTALKKAIEVAEEAFAAMRRSIRPGQTETEMAARLEYEMKRRGASGPSFPTICAVGAGAAVPHAVPGKVKVQRGSAVLFDWGARVGGYCSDLTRMVFVGSIPPKIAEIYTIALKAQEAAIAELRPGRRMCDIDDVARKLITDAGYGDKFGHGLGHGLGLDVHEGPSLSWRSKEKLAAGMVVTVEPGIYLPGIGGVRVEDDLLVTRTGCRSLTSFRKTLRGSVIR